MNINRTMTRHRTNFFFSFLKNLVEFKENGNAKKSGDKKSGDKKKMVKIK